MDDWKSIETAPKDGTRIRVKRDSLEAMVEWSQPFNDWMLERDPYGVQHKLLEWKPTHWMRLP